MPQSPRHPRRTSIFRNNISLGKGTDPLALFSANRHPGARPRETRLVPSAHRTRRQVLGILGCAVLSGVAGPWILQGQVGRSDDVAQPRPQTLPASVPDDFSAIAHHALVAPAEAERTVKSLASYLASTTRNERLIAWAIYRWITDRIRYDIDGLRRGDHQDLTPQEVLRHRQAICSGYANLLLALGREAGLTVEIVEGFAKGIDFDRDASANTPNHAWNAVQLDGAWHLLDATWGAGFIDDHDNFRPAFTAFYFCCPPEHLIWSHLPSEPRWQFLTPPIAHRAFVDRPHLFPDAFALGIRPLNSLTAALRAPARFDLQVPGDVDVSAFLDTADQRRPLPVSRSDPAVVTITVEHLARRARLLLFAARKPATSLGLVLRHDIYMGK